MSDYLDAFFTPDNFRRAWEKVADNQGCAGVDGETLAQFAARAEENLTKLRKVLLTGKYRPLPLLQFFIPKKSGGWRGLAVPTVRDRIVQQALLNVLHPLLEREFEASSYAYRPNRGHHQAVRQIQTWRDRGYQWVLDGDIVEYFDNVRHQRLLDEVEERLDHPLVLWLVEAWLEAGLLTREGLILPEKGLPQGAVISPILANVYLDDFDEMLSATNLKLVRYADDFLVMGKTQQQIIEIQEKIAEVFQDMGLQLHAQKTQITNFKRGFRFLGQVFAGELIIPSKSLKPTLLTTSQPASSLRLIHADAPPKSTAMEQALIEALKAKQEPIPPPLFVVLGYRVREEKTIKIESQEILWRSGMATLYLVNQGSMLRQEGERFWVQIPDESKLEIPIQEIERILIFGNIQLSASVIGTCLYRHIPVIFLSQTGKYKGHLYSAEFCDLQAQQAQFRLQEEAGFSMEIAQAIVRGKLANSKQLLRRLNRKRNLETVQLVIDDLTNYITGIETVSDLDALRGYEGIGAARYFSALGQMIVNPAFSFTERNRRPPKDPINSLLSFGYTLLFNNVLSLILAEGLNPYLGNLHGSEKKELFLGFDLVEEFRSPIVDSLVMALVNKKAFSPTDFTWPDEEGGVQYCSVSCSSYFVRPLNPPILGDFEFRTPQTWGAGGLNRTVLRRCLFDRSGEAVVYPAI
jgi:CRISPR-associated protein Cas1